MAVSCPWCKSSHINGLADTFNCEGCGAVFDHEKKVVRAGKPELAVDGVTAEPEYEEVTLRVSRDMPKGFRDQLIRQLEAPTTTIVGNLADVQRAAGNDAADPRL